MKACPEQNSEIVQIRVHGGSPHGGSPQDTERSPTLVYLPGLHGDWTLSGNFRRALSGRACFVELTYPRTTSWSLDDYGAAVETALASHQIDRAHILAESYGSQVAWALVERGRFGIQSLILAGGFVRHPMRWGVRLARTLGGDVPMSLLTRILFGYAKVARFRYRHSPEFARELDEFIARRTELDRQAAVHRLRLIAQNDPCAVAGETTIPVYAMSGWVDPVVPWFPVRRWLMRNCPALRSFQVFPRADHNVLGTAPELAANQVVDWIKQSGGESHPGTKLQRSTSASCPSDLPA